MAILFQDKTFGELSADIWLKAVQSAKDKNQGSHGYTTAMVPTGSSPQPMREALRSDKYLERAQSVVQGVEFFTMDDYAYQDPEGVIRVLPIDDPRSYAAEHKRELFDPLGVDNNLRFYFEPAARAKEEAERLETTINGIGKINVLTGGIGRDDGHVAFHLPGIPADIGAHVGQTSIDIKEQNDVHCGEDGVPTHFVTHSARTFMGADEAIFLATESKIAILKKAIEAGEQTAELPITFCLHNPNQRVTIVADNALAEALSPIHHKIPRNVSVFGATLS